MIQKIKNKLGIKKTINVKKKFKFEFKEKMILSSIVCFIFIFLFYLLISSYQTGKSSSSILQANFLKNSFKSKQQHMVNLKLASEKIKELEKQIESIQEAMLPHTSISYAMDTISRLGRGENLKFIYFKPQKIEAFKNYQIIPIKISVTGEYQEMINFLKKIADLKRTVILDEFVMMRQGEKGSAVILNAQIDAINSPPKKEDKKPASGAKK